MTQADVSPRALPRLVAFGLDDTLVPPKSAMPPAMAIALRRLLDVIPVCIISGGQVGQLHGQVLAHLDADADGLSQFHLMPICETRYYTYDPPRTQSGEDAWTLVYANNLIPEQIRAGFEIVEAQTRCLGLWEGQTWGTILEDRGSQTTFSALGQKAPLDAKRAWNPAGERKAALRDAVAPLLPGLEVHSGSFTSVDITLEGMDKAYGMKRLAEVTSIVLEEMIFVGNRLDPKGNDHPVKALDIPYQAVSGWQDTVAYVTSLASLIISDVHGGEGPAAQVSLDVRL